MRQQSNFPSPGQSEMREYRLRFWDDGKPVGEWTAWKQITVPG